MHLAEGNSTLTSAQLEGLMLKGSKLINRKKMDSLETTSPDHKTLITEGGFLKFINTENTKARSMWDIYFSSDNTRFAKVGENYTGKFLPVSDKFLDDVDKDHRKAVSRLERLGRDLTNEIAGLKAMVMT